MTLITALIHRLRATLLGGFVGGVMTLMPSVAQVGGGGAWPEYVEVPRKITLSEPPTPVLISSAGPELAVSASVAASDKVLEVAPLADGSSRLNAALAQHWSRIPVLPAMVATSGAVANESKPVITPPRPPPVAGIDEATRAPIEVAAKLVTGPPPTYPSRSRRAGESGSVHLRMRVDADGSVGDVWIVESSGFERLDKAATEAVRAWTFKPATRDGVGVPSLILHTVTFKLDRPQQ